MTSLRDKIGQMFVVGLAGEELTRDDECLLDEYPFGGFILFSRNLKDPEQILSLSRSLRGRKHGLPPFIAVDEEGGRVHRLPPSFTHFPPAGVLGRGGDADLAYRAGLAIALELSAVGINLDFAPVLDIDSNPQNPVIGDRALSSEPERVADLGWAFARGLREGGLIPCGKHFPGHGRTSTDSHQELPVVQSPAEILETVEITPFRHACRNHIESLMTAHVLYPALDPELPATLSPAILQGLLRVNLGYRGVLFSDDMEMRAISGHYGAEEAALLSVTAGADAVLFCHETETAARALETLRREAEAASSIRERVEESYGRIRDLKERRLASFGGGTEELKAIIGCARHRAIVAEIQGSR